MKKKELRIPTLLALLLLLFGLGITVFIVEYRTSLFSLAQSSNEPTHVEIVNITEDSFSVSWLTAVPTRGTLQYQERGILSTSKTAFDIRDGSGQTTARHTHFVTVSNLKPRTQYDVILLINKGVEKVRLTATTSIALPPPTHVVDPAFGTVRTDQSEPIHEALVYASFPGSQTLGTVVDPDNTWVLPLGSIRTSDGNHYFIPTPQDQEKLVFVSVKGEKEILTTIDDDSPLPPLHLTPISSKSVKGVSHVTIAQSQTFPTNSGSVNSVFQVQLPKSNASLTSTKPAFKGTGVAGKKVTITLISQHTPLVGKTTVTSSGIWNWTPPELSPGVYTATITSFTENDKPVALSLNFTVLKSGTAVLQAATPAASLFASPISTPRTSPRISPSATVSATPITIATASPVPVTGTSMPTFFLLAMAGIILLFGILGLIVKTGH